MKKQSAEKPAASSPPAASGNDPAAVESLFYEGNRHLAAGRASAAEACFCDALRLAPDLAEAHANLGLLYEQEGRWAAAEERYRCSLQLNPRLFQVWLNLGALLLRQKRLDEAEAAYWQARLLRPDSPAAWSCLGVLQACRQQELEAEQSYRLAMTLGPEYRPAQFNLSYLLLRQGRYEEGWQCLEARDWYAVLEKNLSCPRWRGEPLAGRSLVIGFEAGHGDMIQFCRYAAVAKDHGATRIAMICHPALKRLFSSLEAVDVVCAYDEVLASPEWDFWTPPFSMPYYFQTRLDSIPARLPYLRAEAQLVARWAPVVSGGGVPTCVRVGLVWKGSPQFENDADRSLPGLHLLAPLAAVAGVRFFSLQKGPGAAEAAHPPPGMLLTDLGPQLADFADTAAILAGLDLVISVDTAVAHLAGALGRQCWLLLPDYKTDWRWLTTRSDSPWYPGVMRLFRQPGDGDWEAVITEVAAALREFVAVRRRGVR